MDAKKNIQHSAIGSPSTSVREKFKLTGRVAVITGGAGMLGIRHAETVAELGGIPVLIDLDKNKIQAAVEQLNETYGLGAIGHSAMSRQNTQWRLQSRRLLAKICLS